MDPPDVPELMAPPEEDPPAAPEPVEPEVIAPPDAPPEAGAAEASGVAAAVEDVDGVADDDASAAPPASAFFLAQAPRVRRLTLARASAVLEIVVIGKGP